MNTPALSLGQNIDGIYRLTATLGMDGIVSRLLCAGTMQPFELTINPCASFIEMDGFWRLNQVNSHLLINGRNSLSQLCGCRAYRPIRDVLPVQFAENLSRSL